jgi:hypothetical protein
MKKLFLLLAFLGLAGAVLLVLQASSPIPKFDEIAYPKGKSFIQFTREDIDPYFYKLAQKPITYGRLRFALWDRMPAYNQAFRASQKFDPDYYRKKFSGATVQFSSDTVIINGIRRELPMISNRDTNDRLALGMANYDEGIGLMVNFTPLPFKVYNTPLSKTHFRAYTLSPDGSLTDKTHMEVDLELQTIHDVEFYLAALDALIKGDFEPSLKLPEYQQQVIVDTVSICIAEYYVGYKVDFYPWLPKSMPDGRMAPRLTNLLDSLFYNYGGLALIDKKSGGFKIRKGELRYFYSGSSYLSPTKTLNEQIITKVLRSLYPKEFEQLDQVFEGKFADNFYNRLAYLAEKPDLYTGQTRLVIHRLVNALAIDVKTINKNLQQTLKRNIAGSGIS